MATHFLSYWEQTQFERELNERAPFRHSASAQYRRVTRGDIVWVVTVTKPEKRMILGGRIEVTDVTTKARASRILRTKKLWDAPFHILSRKRNVERFFSIDVTHIAMKLEFESKGARFLEPTPNQWPHQLQTMRTLAPGGIHLFKAEWEKHAIHRPTSNAEEFRRRVTALVRGAPLPVPQGQQMPMRRQASVLVYERDPQVKAFVLRLAEGICELCRNPAPFEDDDGLPYLEVHHVQRLADGGGDTVDNAVAICSNCHRALHLAKNRPSLVQKLCQNVSRLRLQKGVA